MSIDAIEAGLRVSENYLSTVDALIKNQVINSWPDRIPGIDAIARAIDSQIAKAESTLRTAETAIKQQIEPLLKNAIPNVLDVVVNLTKTLDDNVAKLINNIATTDDVLAVAIKSLEHHSPALAHWVYNNVAGSFGHIALGLMETLENEAPDAINPILDELLAIKELPPWIHNGIKHARARNAPIFAFIFPAIILASILPLLAALGEPFIISAKQQALKVAPTKVAEPPTLIEALMRGNINDTRFFEEMRQSGFAQDVSSLMLHNAQPLLEPEIVTRLFLRGQIELREWETEITKRGFNTEQAQHMLVASQQLLPEDAIRNAFLRGIYDAPKHDAALAQYGYPADRAALLRQLYFYIPPPQDLIHFGIRNVFNPEIVQRFELDHDKPAAFVSAAAQQGISDFWAGKYWQSHWIMPGREAFFEMFQRTVDEPLDPQADTITLSDGTHVHNIMGRNTLNLALRDIDTPPFYRDKLTEIAYHPLTRIDIRRLASLGLLTHAQVERAYLDLGYNQKRARQLADFTEALNKRAKKDETATLTDGLRKQILRLYTANKLDGDAAKTALAEIGASETEIAVYLAESDVVRESELATAVEAGIGKLYVAGQITDKDATQRLQSAGVPVDAMGTLFAKWDLEIEYRGGTAHIHAHKELTKGEVLESLVDGLIDESTAKSFILDLGYEDLSADAEIHLALFRADKATKTAQVDAVKASFVNGNIDALEASNRLDALFVPAEKRDADLAIWTLQRETRTERIPLATLRDMVRGSLLTETEALAHLKRHRFTDADADLMLRYWTNAAPKKS